MPKKPKFNEVACPKCKEPISVDAQICPHCRTAFGPEEIAIRRKAYRKASGIGCGCLAVVLIGVVALAVGGNEDGDPATKAADAESAAPATDATRSAGRQFYSSIFAALKPCDAAASQTAELGERMQQGDASVYDGYDAGKRQEEACRNSWATLADLDVPDELEGAAATAAEEAKRICQNAAIAKQMGGETLKEIMDGDAKPSRLAELKEQASQAQVAVLACAAAATEVATKAGLQIDELPKLD